jgi:hypothetical protein
MVRLWDLATGAACRTFEGHSDWVWAVAFSPTSKLVASGSKDRTIRLWDAATRATSHTLEGHSSTVEVVALSPDDKLVPADQPQSHETSVDPSVPSNNPQLDTLRQPGINAQNSTMAPSNFGTSSSKSLADGPPPNPRPPRPVFGVFLNELYRREGSAVPMIVYRCVQAVDLFGLDVEGIYRVRGSVPHIMEMKAMFDNGKHPKNDRLLLFTIIIRS